MPVPTHRDVLRFCNYLSNNHCAMADKIARNNRMGLVKHTHTSEGKYLGTVS